MLTQEYLKGILDYNPETGVFTWKTRKDTTSTINTKYSGKPAGFLTAKGYWRLGINGNVYFGHTIAYCIYHGIWVEQIDHENHIRHDNRIINLKKCSTAENAKNKKKISTNTSGVTGVYFIQKRNKFRAIITSDNKRIHLGYFENIEQAKQCRDKAEREHNFHCNHGK